MGFGSFTLGYLLGQSFQNPQDIIETPGKCQADYDNDNDPELRAYGEECYWRAWDKACKEKVIERLRNHEEGFSFFSTKTQDEQADLIESGELRIAAPTQGMGEGLGLVWADENREETKGSKYQENLKIIMNKVKEGVYRIVI